MTDCIVKSGWFTGQAICQRCGDDCECYICTHELDARREGVMHATDIVGYTYRADVYCPQCIIDMCREDGTDAPLDVPSDSDSETHLDYYAKRLGINREREWTFDSDHFPKVIFEDSTHDACDADMCVDQCGQCGEYLGADECPVIQYGTP